MPSSPFALAPKSGLLNDPEKPTSIRIRTFREGDGPRVRELFRLGIGYGPGSSREAALKGSLKRPNSIACYILFVVGLFQFFSTSTSACSVQHISGVFLCLVSATFFCAHRWKLNEIIKRHADSDKHPDMADIVKHYKLQVVSTTEGGANEKESARSRSSVTGTVGPDGFWVAEVVQLGREDGEVVGCVGLDTSTTSPSPHTAELRRMAVSHSLQRRGIGKMLLETALAHATLHDIREVHLSTTGYQASAVGIYEKFGWKLLGKTKLNAKIAPPWVDFKLVHYRLELGGAPDGVGRDVKEWQKMA